MANRFSLPAWGELEGGAVLIDEDCLRTAVDATDLTHTLTLSL